MVGRVLRPKANANTPFGPEGIPNMAKPLVASIHPASDVIGPKTG